MSRILCCAGACLWVLMGAGAAGAQSLDCDAPTRVIPDGRLNGGSIPAGAVLWFSFSTSQPLASYQVEANFPQGAATMPTLGVFAPGDVGAGPTCAAGGSSIVTRDTTALTPEAPNGQRFSFQKTTPGMATFLIRVSNPGMASEALTLRVAETTLFSSAWSTFGTFDTFYSFVNTTNASIDLTLKLFNTTGTEVASVNLTVPANQTLSTNTGVLMVPRSQNGSALLRHNGPTGGLLVEAAIANFAVPPGVIQPVKFQELRAAGPSGGADGAGGGGGGGDITAVNTMMMGGLEGGATGGEVNLSLLTSCLNGQVLKWTGTMWSCQDDSVGAGGGGDVTAVNTPLAGGLEGGSVSGDANLSLNTKCATGDVLKWDGSAWVCTATPATDADGNVGIGTGASSDAALVVEATGGDAAAQFTGGPVTVSPFGPIPVDPRILLKLAGSGGVTSTDRTLQVENSTTNMTTDGIDKIGLEVMSTGTFTGSGGMATVNTGLMVEVSGADINQAATFTGGVVGIGTISPDPNFTLEVVGDMKINSLFDVGTDPCTALSASGRSRLCFNGTEFVVSEDGGAYRDLLSAGDTVSGSTTPAILMAIQNAPGVMNPTLMNLPPSGLFGEATSTTDTVVGVLGVASGAGSNQSIGVAGLSVSTDGTGVVADALSPTGNTTGIEANVESPTGKAARFVSTAGGDLISGSDGIQEVFLVDSTGNVTATAFVGDGSGLTNLPSGSGTVTDITAGAGLTATPSNPITTSGTLDVDFAGPGAADTVARSDHTHAQADTTNTAVGQGALAVNSGVSNTAVGKNALSSNVSGTGNTAVGDAALSTNTNGDNTAVGNGALQFSTTGVFNTAVGGSASRFNTTASNNTAVGGQALLVNTVGTGNTAVGRGALLSNTASDNTAVGRNALTSNSSGTDNTAVGTSALDSNTTGFRNTALGRGALNSIIGACCSTAVGTLALATNTGANNTAVGDSALATNPTGTGNAALGQSALLMNVGSSNTAVGGSALIASTMGDGNIAIGNGAGSALVTGSNNIYIGGGGASTESGNIRIGIGGTHTATFIAGIDGTNVGASSTVLINSSGQLGTVSSTRRVKENINLMGDASAGLLQLRPVTFRYRQAMANGSKPLQYGLIAEEVAEVMPELVVYDAEGQPQTVQYHVLPALLLNELQRQHTRANRQEEELAALRQLLAAQSAELAELKAALRTTLAQREQ